MDRGSSSSVQGIKSLPGGTAPSPDYRIGNLFYSLTLAIERTTSPIHGMSESRA